MIFVSICEHASCAFIFAGTSCDQIGLASSKHRELRTSGVGPGQRSRFLALTKRSVAPGNENDFSKKM